MGRARSVNLDTRNFAKVGDARAFFSQMLNRYNIGETVNDEDHLDLIALLKLHDEHKEKVGAGILEFQVDSAPDSHPGKCFWIIRTDRSKIDFSFMHCLK